MPTDLSYLQNFLISLLLLLFTNNNITTNKRVIGYFRQEFFIVFKLWFVGVVISAVVRPYAFNLLCITLMLDMFFLVVNFKCCVHYINHFLNSFFPHHSSNLFLHFSVFSFFFHLTQLCYTNIFVFDHFFRYMKALCTGLADVQSESYQMAGFCTG